MAAVIIPTLVAVIIATVYAPLCWSWWEVVVTVVVVVVVMIVE